MKIGPRRTDKKNGRKLLWLFILILVFLMGLIVGETGWSGQIRDALIGAARRFDRPQNDLPTLFIDITFQNYNNFILAQREEALTQGVFIAAEADFAPATIRLDDDEIPVRLRLTQGPARHLGQDEKWNFEGRTRDNQLLLGMQRFYLLDPADNNWLHEWAYARTLQREGVLASRYQFVNLVFNGEAWGIYALQEGFGTELMTTQNRQEGVIIEFDAGQLWQSMAYFEGDIQAAAADPMTRLAASDFPYFEVDTFRDTSIARDPVLSQQKDEAIGLLRGLQNGDLAAADVFDVQQYGRFLALTDLWGATTGTALVNLRYYYNPDNGRLEPIGFNANALGSQARISPDATYNDMALQLAYIEAVARFSQPDYLADLQSELGPELITLQAALQSETDVDLPWEALATRQGLMQRSLDPIQPVFAYLGSPTLALSATIQIDVANVLHVPVEILGFDIDGATFLDPNRAWLQGDSASLLTGDEDRIILKALDEDENAIRYVRFHLPLAEIVRLDDELDFMHDPVISVATRIIGVAQTQLTPAQPGYPAPIINRAQIEAGE